MSSNPSLRGADFLLERILEQLADLSPFNWIGESTDQDSHPESIWGFVSEYLPVNYAAYCKVFHAIYQDLAVTDKSITWDEVRSKGNADSSEQVERVSWQDLATEYSLKFHAEINQDSFALNFPKGSWPRHLIAPREGTLDEEECTQLVAVLSLFTIDQSCHFYYDSIVRTTDDGNVGTLYQGELTGVDELSGASDYYTTPTYWWPEDKSWTVFTDPQYTFTIVGGTQALIDSILAEPILEAVRVELKTRITPNSDDINIQDDKTETT